MEQILGVLRRYDSMPYNKDFPNQVFVDKVLDIYGYLPLLVFICPATRGKYLYGDKKELFMPLDEPENGLLFSRIPKIKLLIRDLWKLGIPSKIMFVVADNSYELYRGPVEGIILDQAVMDERRTIYSANLLSRLSKDFPQLIEVFSLGLNKIGLANSITVVPNDVITQETEFQKKVVFSRYYEGNIPDDSTIERIVKGKCLAYAEQGLLIDTADALLIGTEGSDTVASWLLRTRMLKLAGANFPVIYPYIRKEVPK